MSTFAANFGPFDRIGNWMTAGFLKMAIGRIRKIMSTFGRIQLFGQKRPKPPKNHQFL